MALTAWPVTPPDWLLPWVIWRFRGKPDPRPVGVPPIIPKWAWEFLQWCEWRRKGAQAATRPDIIPKIPQWAWPILKQLMIAVPLVPPPPPPPPPPTYVDSFTLPRPLMFTTWGWMNDSDFRDHPEQMAQKMWSAGVKTVCLQIGQFDSAIPGILRAVGHKVCLWGSPDSNDQAALDNAQADGYMPQVEGLYEYERARDNLVNGVGQGLDLAVVTTNSGFDTFFTRPDGSSTTREAEIFIASGCTRAVVECYKQGGPSHFPISKMAWSANHRGFPYFTPLIGLYWDVDVDEYQPDLAEYGKNVGAYTAETMRPIDWAKFSALGT